MFPAAPRYGTGTPIYASSYILHRDRDFIKFYKLPHYQERIYVPFYEYQCSQGACPWHCNRHLFEKIYDGGDGFALGAGTIRSATAAADPDGTEPIVGGPMGAEPPNGTGV